MLADISAISHLLVLLKSSALHLLGLLFVRLTEKQLHALFSLHVIPLRSSTGEVLSLGNQKHSDIDIVVDFFFFFLIHILDQNGRIDT